MSIPRLYLNQDEDYDWLIALEYGRVDDGVPADHWQVVGDDEFGYLHDGPGGPIVGFRVQPYSSFDPDDPSVSEIWTAAQFEVPLLGLARANAGEIILAARALLGNGSTLNRAFFSAAVNAQDESPEESLQRWLQCLQTGDSMAHFALGYTLFDLGRHHEAYRHLRYYIGIAPAGAWNWCWLGKAAAAIGETDEARQAYERAILLDTDNETDAREQLAALEAT